MSSFPPQGPAGGWPPTGPAPGGVGWTGPAGPGPPAAPPRGGGRVWLVLTVLSLVVLLVAGSTLLLLLHDGPPEAGVQPTAEPGPGVPAPDVTPPALPVPPTPAPPAPPAPAPPVLDADLLVARFGDAVWRVEAQGCGLSSTGTAFVVGERWLVTNWHVTAIDTSPQVVTRDDTRVLQARVLGWSREPDLAVLEVDAPLAPVLGWADPVGLRAGEPILALGFPRPDYRFAATVATIRSFAGAGGNREAIVVDGGLQEGNSGGPALTADGRVAGIVTEAAAVAGGPRTPILYTYTHLAAELERIVATRPGAVVDCDAVGVQPSFPAPGWELTDR